ncbi:thermonuclease family protein [Pontibacillus salipaludis]|uniref:thermonuclease family protein n=1 Tax=Pontibacillus salipaludis TaxID=1697394 RepID=UPI0031EAFF49
MNNVFIILVLLSFFGLIVGLIAPKLAIFWNKNQASRKKVLKIYPAIFAISFILGALTAPPLEEEKEQPAVSDEADTTEEEATEKDTEEKPTSSDEESKEDQYNEKKSSEDSEQAESKDSSEEENDKKSQRSEENKSSSKENNDTGEKEDSPYEQATVSRVVDGDTIEVTYNGTTEDVRLLLVDTPEVKHPSKPVQEFGPEASAYAKKMLTPGTKVELEFDGPKRDKYDRLLAYIWVDGQNFNKALLENGYARLAYRYDPPYTHYETFMKAQNQAKSKNLGIWSVEGNYVQDDGFHQEVLVTESAEEETQQQETTKEQNRTTSLPYDPNGPDRDCGDFDSHETAQAFFEAAGGPEEDPHRLDGSDDDGLACESL